MRYCRQGATFRSMSQTLCGNFRACPKATSAKAVDGRSGKVLGWDLDCASLIMEHT